MLAKLRQLDRILRGEATRLAELRQGTIDISVRGLSLILLVLALFYGACMGLFALITDYSSRYDGPMHGWRQVLYSTVKVPALFFLTLVITFPSLYVFNALVGSRLTVKSVLRLLVAAIGVLLAVLASFGTIVAFFAVSTTSYPFMVILNVVIFAVSGILGLLFLFQTLHRLTVAQEQAPVEPTLPAASAEAPAEPPAVPREPSALDRLQGHALSQNVKAVFRIWVVVFALVGAQMGWVLRPFIGRPDQPTTFVRPRESNFFEGVWRNLQRLLTEQAMAPSLLLSADDLLRTGLARPDGRAPRLPSLAELLTLVLVFGLLYGAAMGTFTGFAPDRAVQILYSALKVPLLLLATFVLSLPSFFVINTLLGLRGDFAEAVRALVATQAGLTVVLASLAPFTVLFYASSDHYQVAQLFNAAMFAVASVTAQFLLKRLYAPLIARDRRHLWLVRAWLVVYAFVGIQMGWVLRPFIGKPEMQPTFFREEAFTNAYQAVLRIVSEVVGR